MLYLLQTSSKVGSDVAERAQPASVLVYLYTSTVMEKIKQNINFAQSNKSPEAREQPVTTATLL